MKEPALKNNRFKTLEFKETSWTNKSKNIGEYIFRRISLDQSNKDLQNIRPVHQMSKLVITSYEINSYVDDYLKMVDRRTYNISAKKINLKSSHKNSELNNDLHKYLGHS